MEYPYCKPSSERLLEALERAREYWKRRRVPELHLPPAPNPIPPPFTIALSREAGTDGLAVARAVGNRLGWPVYDHELVEGIARDMGVRTDLVESLDERRVNWLEEFFETFIAGLRVSESGYVYHLVQTFFSLAAHGECVIVGRGATQVLPPETTLRVRLIGPRHDRILAAQRRLGGSADEAARWVDKTDRERREFVRAHFQKDLADMDGYDLILNASRIPPEPCAEVIATALHQLQEKALPCPPAAHPAGATA